MKILILDIETTGFLDTGGKIVEVGIVSLNTETGARKIIFNQVCHETGITRSEVENAWIVKNSDLTVDAIRHSKNLEVLKPVIQHIIDSYPDGATAFNNTFDFGFLENRGIVFCKKLPCPMRLATPIIKLPGRRGYKWPKVEEAYEYYFGKTEYVEQHRGADDAMHEAEIVYEMINSGEFPL